MRCSPTTCTRTGKLRERAVVGSQRRDKTMAKYLAPLILLCSLLITSCSTLVTTDYVRRNRQVSEIFQQMTEERALDILRARFTEDTRTKYSDNDYSITEVVAINHLGVDYKVFTRSSPIRTSSSLPTFPGEVWYKITSGNSYGHLTFSDVKTLKIRHDISEMRLLDSRGQILKIFDLGGLWGRKIGQVNQPWLSGTEVNELIAALLFLCPDAR